MGTVQLRCTRAVGKIDDGVFKNALICMMKMLMLGEQFTPLCDIKIIYP